MNCNGLSVLPLRLLIGMATESKKNARIAGRWTGWRNHKKIICKSSHLILQYQRLVRTNLYNDRQQLALIEHKKRRSLTGVFVSAFKDVTVIYLVTETALLPLLLDGSVASELMV